MTYKYINRALSQEHSSIRHIWQDTITKKYFISSDERLNFEHDGKTIFLELKEKLNPKTSRQLTDKEVINKIINYDKKTWTFVL
jgi:hypothetical protein